MDNRGYARIVSPLVYDPLDLLANFCRTRSASHASHTVGTNEGAEAPVDYLRTAAVSRFIRTAADCGYFKLHFYNDVGVPSIVMRFAYRQPQAILTEIVFPSRSKCLFQWEGNVDNFASYIAAFQPSPSIDLSKISLSPISHHEFKSRQWRLGHGRRADNYSTFSSIDRSLSFDSFLELLDIFRLMPMARRVSYHTHDGWTRTPTRSLSLDAVSSCATVGESGIVLYLGFRDPGNEFHEVGFIRELSKGEKRVVATSVSVPITRVYLYDWKGDALPASHLEGVYVPEHLRAISASPPADQSFCPGPDQ